MNLSCASALLASMLAFGATAALAQSSGERAQPSAPSTDADRPGTLSDKLGDTGGVIHPKGNVDPNMDRAAPKAAGNTPVIKPPGTGGRPGPTPK